MRPLMARRLRPKFIGKDVHTATAKGIMVNAIQLAMDFHALLPKDEVPEKTEGRQGFSMCLICKAQSIELV